MTYREIETSLAIGKSQIKTILDEHCEEELQSLDSAQLDRS